MFDIDVLLNRLDQLESKNEQQGIKVAGLEAKVAEHDAKAAEQEVKMAGLEVKLEEHQMKISSQQEKIGRTHNENQQSAIRDRSVKEE